MMKKILATMFMVMSLFIGSNILVSGSAEAADVWVYSDSAKGETIYVMDETAYNFKASATDVKVSIKRVFHNGYYEKEYWEFGADEGHLWATKNKGNNGFPIDGKGMGPDCCKPHNRPDLMAVYKWVRSNIPYSQPF